MTAPSPAAAPPRFHRWLFLVICLVGWSALVAVTASFMSMVKELPFSAALHLALGFWGFYALAAPLVLWLARRWPLTGPRWRRSLGAHLLGMLMFVLICEGGFLGMIVLLEPEVATVLAERQNRSPGRSGAEKDGLSSSVERDGDFGGGLPEPSLKLVLFKSQFGIPLYWVIVGVSHSLGAMALLREKEKQAAELAAHLAQAQLAGLRAQLQPHFIFNTLNSIAALIPHDGKLATEMILNLSDLLRMTLRGSQHGAIPLSRELKLIRHYVDIQRLRFGERLEFHTEVTDAALHAAVPPMILQPLVENAILHGVETSDQTGRVTVRARAADGQLLLEVANTGGAEPSLEPPPAAASTGVGLANTRARLKVHYGDRHRFQAAPRAGGGFLVVMSLPLTHSPAAE